MISSSPACSRGTLRDASPDNQDETEESIVVGEEHRGSGRRGSVRSLIQVSRIKSSVIKMYKYYTRSEEQFDTLFLSSQRILSFDAVSGFRIDVMKDVTPFFKVSHSYGQKRSFHVDSFWGPPM